MTVGIRFGRVEQRNNVKKVVIVGSGKSLTDFDFNLLKHPDYYVIGINDSVQSIPFADAWFTLDPWGLNGPQLPKSPFKGKMYAGVPSDFGRSDAYSPKHRIRANGRITYLHRLISNNLMGQSSELAFSLELSEDPRSVATGNSGYGAFNIAYHLKPEKILLLGLDGDVGYFYTDKNRNRPLTHLPKMFNSTKDQIERNGITVINGSQKSTITTYPRYSIDEALEIFNAN